MKNKILFAVVFCLTLSIRLAAQQVKLITIAQLESRFKQGNDTTYVVNFWATWCRPCVKELPEFEKYGRTVQGKKIKIILVSTDLKAKLESGVVPFVTSHRLSEEVYLLDEVANTYAEKISPDWSGAIPGTLIVKAGKRKFHETAYTYEELVDAVKLID